MITINELLFTGKLQLKKLQKLKPCKKFRLRWGSNPAASVPDTARALLPTEIRSHMLGARQILLGSLFPLKEYPITKSNFCNFFNCSLPVKIYSLLENRKLRTVNRSGNNLNQETDNIILYEYNPAVSE